LGLTELERESIISGRLEEMQAYQDKLALNSLVKSNQGTKEESPKRLNCRIAGRYHPLTLGNNLRDANLCNF
jgi:hypothetical protein